MTNPEQARPADPSGLYRCTTCGRFFKPTRKVQRFCSEKCKQQWRKVANMNLTNSPNGLACSPAFYQAIAPVKVKCADSNNG